MRLAPRGSCSDENDIQGGVIRQRPHPKARSKGLSLSSSPNRPPTQPFGGPGSAFAKLMQDSAPCLKEQLQQISHQASGSRRGCRTLGACTCFSAASRGEATSGSQEKSTDTQFVGQCGPLALVQTQHHLECKPRTPCAQPSLLDVLRPYTKGWDSVEGVRHSAHCHTERETSRQTATEGSRTNGGGKRTSVLVPDVVDGEVVHSLTAQSTDAGTIGAGDKDMTPNSAAHFERKGIMKVVMAPRQTESAECEPVSPSPMGDPANRTKRVAGMCREMPKLEAVLREDKCRPQTKGHDVRTPSGASTDGCGVFLQSSGANTPACELESNAAPHHEIQLSLKWADLLNVERRANRERLRQLTQEHEAAMRAQQALQAHREKQLEHIFRDRVAKAVDEAERRCTLMVRAEVARSEHETHVRALNRHVIHMQVAMELYMQESYERNQVVQDSQYELIELCCQAHHVLRRCLHGEVRTAAAAVEEAQRTQLVLQVNFGRSAVEHNAAEERLCLMRLYFTRNMELASLKWQQYLQDMRTESDRAERERLHQYDCLRSELVEGVESTKADLVKTFENKHCELHRDFIEKQERARVECDRLVAEARKSTEAHLAHAYDAENRQLTEEVAALKSQLAHVVLVSQEERDVWQQHMDAVKEELLRVEQKWTIRSEERCDAVRREVEEKRRAASQFTETQLAEGLQCMWAFHCSREREWLRERRELLSLCKTAQSERSDLMAEEYMMKLSVVEQQARHRLFEQSDWVRQRECDTACQLEEMQARYAVQVVQEAQQLVDSHRHSWECEQKQREVELNDRWERLFQRLLERTNQLTEVHHRKEKDHQERLEQLIACNHEATECRLQRMEVDHIDAMRKVQDEWVRNEDRRQEAHMEAERQRWQTLMDQTVYEYECRLLAAREQTQALLVEQEFRATNERQRLIDSAQRLERELADTIEAHQRELETLHEGHRKELIEKDLETRGELTKRLAKAEFSHLQQAEKRERELTVTFEARLTQLHGELEEKARECLHLQRRAPADEEVEARLLSRREVENRGETHYGSESAMSLRDAQKGALQAMQQHCEAVLAAQAAQSEERLERLTLELHDHFRRMTAAWREETQEHPSRCYTPQNPHRLDASTTTDDAHSVAPVFARGLLLTPQRTPRPPRTPLSVTTSPQVICNDSGVTYVTASPVVSSNFSCGMFTAPSADRHLVEHPTMASSTCSSSPRTAPHQLVLAWERLRELWSVLRLPRVEQVAAQERLHALPVSQQENVVRLEIERLERLEPLAQSGVMTATTSSRTNMMYQQLLPPSLSGVCSSPLRCLDIHQKKNI